MRFHLLTLGALAATATAQSGKPKISADELVESMKALTEAMQDAVKMTDGLPSEDEAIRTLSKDLIDVGRGSSVVVQALPRPAKVSTFKYTDEEQGPICDNFEKLVDAAFSLVDGLNSAVDTLPKAPEFTDPIKHSVGFMGKALGGLVRRTVLVTDCEGVGDEVVGELRKGFEGSVKDL